MEKKIIETIISESEFLKLANAAKENNSEAIIRLIDIFKDDILRLSKYICLPDEEAVSEIIVEFLEYLQNETYP